TLRLSSNDPLNPVVDVPVALTVTGPVISVSPSSFSLTLGQNVTKDTTLTISNLGNATLSWSLSEVPQVDWLTEYPTSGEIPGLDETNVTLSVNTEWLLPGVYSCTLRLSSNDPLNPVVDVPVALTVTGPVISVSPSSFSLTLGQNVTKDTTLVIYNQGNATLSWSLAETPTVDWLTEYPTTGEIPASGNSDVTVSFNTSGMTPGVYNTTLRLSSNDPLNPVVDVSVTLTISGTQRPIISVVPSSIVVVLDKGLSKDTTLTIRNLGNVMLTWNLEELSEVNWLSEDPTSGEIFPDSSVNITISFTTTGLVSWDYHCILKITSNDPGNPEVNVPITLIIPGWVRRTNIPSKMQHKLRFVRNGGAVVGVNDTMIYAFRGNRSNEFYAYLISQDSWVAKESIRFGYKPEDTTQINKKKVNRGAALCYDGDSLIYAIKGGNTRELWVYDIRNDFWMLRSFVPIRRNLKGGSALAYRNGRVYLLAGGQKTEDKNFLAYNVNTNTWDTLKSPPLIPDNKKFRDGSSIAIIGDTIYCLKGGGRHNYFWLYEIANDTWILKETIPLRHSMLTDKRNKANKVKDGAAITTDGKTIFAIKGGGKQDFWQYLPQVDRWIPQDTVPRLPESKKSVPKNGAALTYADGKVWLLKGNNTPEFWSYTIGIVPNVNVNIMTHNSQKIHTSNVALLYQNYPNPFMTQTAISYILPVPTYASLAIYDASGRLVKTLVKGLIQPGRHTVKWDGTDEYGKKVNPGIYFYTLQTAQGKIARKLVILD
ncbi:MAG: FlgD immunoglobulin-like domain containing protein, partial [candidate division WOR-3 bacterium]